MHGRQKVIRAAQNILLGKPWAPRPVYPSPEVGARIFRNRPTPVWKPEVPCVCLYAMTDVGDDKDSTPRTYDRKIRLVAEIIVAATIDGDALADVIAEKVEALLLQSRFLPDPAFIYTSPDVKANYIDHPEIDPANTTADFKYLDTEIVFVGENVENVVTSCRIAFEPLFEYDPAILGPTGIFDKMHVNYDGDSKAVDSVEHIHQEE